MPTNVRPRDPEPDAQRPSDTHDADVERLAREFAEVVDSVPDSERESLRDYAVELFRDEAETARHRETEAAAVTGKRPLGVFGFAVLLVMAGGALLFVLPPVGIVLLLLAVPVAGWGLVRTAFARAPDPPAE